MKGLSVLALPKDLCMNHQTDEMNKINTYINNNLQVPHPHSGSSSTWLIPGRIGIWKCWFLRRGENWSTRRKTSRNKGENQQQTQTTYGVDAEIEPGPHWWETSALTTAPPLLCTNGLVYVWKTTKRWVDTAKADLPTNDKGKLGDSWQKKNWTFYKKYVEFYFFLIKIWGEGGISIY